VLGDGSLVRVGELSDLEIDKLDVDASNQPTTSRFNLAAGQARAWVARQVVAKVSTGTGRFAIQSPTAVAAVRQTDFALANGRVYTFAGVVETRSSDPSITGFVLCGRNRYTEAIKQPTPCRVIPLSEKRRLLAPDALAVEGVFLEPNNLDNVAFAPLIQLLSDEKLTGAWSSLGPGSSTGRSDAPTEGQGIANVGVTVK
jgi:FecR-like protein